MSNKPVTKPQVKDNIITIPENWTGKKLKRWLEKQNTRSTQK